MPSLAHSHTYQCAMRARFAIQAKRMQRAEMKTTTIRCELFLFIRFQSNAIVRIFMQRTDETVYVDLTDSSVFFCAYNQSNKTNQKNNVASENTMNWLVADCFCPTASHRCVCLIFPNERRTNMMVFGVCSVHCDWHISFHFGWLNVQQTKLLAASTKKE